MTETTTDAPAAPKVPAPRTQYRFFKKVEQEDGQGATAVETRELYELIPSQFEGVRQAHAAAGDGEFVGVPVRSFNPTTVKSETTTRVVIA